MAETDLKAEHAHRASDVRAALARIAATPYFDKSPQLAHFLTYVVEEALAGRGDRIKAYTIATDALGRDASFDPQHDPIVRVEAARLRRALQSYYANEGSNDPIIIDLPRGNYAPEFHHRSDQVTLTSRAQRLRVKIEGRVASASRLSLIIFSLIAGVLAATAMDVLVIDFLGRPKEPASRAMLSQAELPPRRMQPGLPRVFVEAVSSVGAQQAEALVPASLRDRLVDALAQFDEVEAVDGFRLPQTPANPPPTDSQVEYRLATSVELRTGATANLSFRLVDSSRKVIIWSRTIEGVQEQIGSTARIDEIIRDVTDTVAGLNGVIQAAERTKRAVSGGLDQYYSCLLDSAAYLRQFDPATHVRVRKCLEDAIKAYPHVALGYAYLARVYVREHYFNIDPRPDAPALDRAWQLARRALELRPESARAYEALMTTLVARREIAAAIAAGEKATRLNPYASDIKADYGFRLVTLGKVAEGMALLKEAGRRSSLLPNAAGTGLALGAYLSDDLPQATLYLNALNSDIGPIPKLLRVAIAADSGDVEGTRRATATLVAAYPYWRANQRRELEKLFVAPELVERLIRALARAGLTSIN